MVSQIFIFDRISSMFKARLQNIRQKLNEENLDGVFISSVATIEYLTGYSNFSKEEREAYIFVGEDFEYIITDARYSEAIKKEVPHLKLYERGGGKTTKDLFVKHKIKRLGIEEDNLTVAEHKAIKKHFKSLKHFEVGDLRSIKSDDEIEKIKQACKLGDLAFKFILEKLKAGVTEKQIAQELENFIRQQGATNSFPTIVAFGKNSSVPHHQTGNTKLNSGDFVLLDFGVKFENYCSDMTRTVIFGKPTDKQKEIYPIVLKAQQKAVEYINNQIRLGKKVKAGEVDKVARDYIISKNYPSIPHSLGHGIGLEVHERPYLSAKNKAELREGMVFSIEPGIYIPDFGGVRIEDLFVIEEDQLRQITNSPKELIILLKSF